MKRKWNGRRFILGMTMTAMLIGGIIAGTAIHTYALDGEWKQNEKGWWYEYSDGTYLQNQWLQNDQNGNWYWLGSDGYAAIGWTQINGKWYYFDENAVMRTGLQTITNTEGVTNTYYFTSSGEMLTGWQQVSSGDWRYFNTSGAMSADNSYAADSLKGIDVSKYQKDIDWTAVKNDGIQFAFIRVGHDEHVLDPYFVKNIEAANAADMPVGVYFYSTSTTLEQSISDAQWVIDQLQGHLISYPVVIDLEDKSQSGSMTKGQITELGKVFCDEIRKAGYTPMIYCNENWAKNYINLDGAGDIERWIARYNGIYDTSVKRDIWQGGSTARIQGIDGNVDVNFSFVDYTQVITPRTHADSSYVKTTGVWRQDGTGYWYSYIYKDSNGNDYPQNQWLQIDGNWYWFNDSGYLSNPSGWQMLDNEWYYYDADGTAASGWREINGSWYYMLDNGKMATGWVNVDNKWYYMGDAGDGVMKTGWQEQNGSWYYLNDSGAAANGWAKIKGSWYYFDPDSNTMVSGWRVVDGSWYYFGNAGDGSMKTGWQEINGRWYYFGNSNDGTMATGWLRNGGRWYYMGASDDGAMKTGWDVVDGVWYYFGSAGDGSMKTGWQKINNHWYYLGNNNDGAMKTGWLKINGSWYYLGEDGDGAMATGWQLIDGSWYYLGSAGDGAMKTGWQKINGNWYYMYGSGVMASNAWVGGYYVDESGVWR